LIQSPKAVVDEAIKGALCIDEREADIMSQNPKYMFALGFRIASLPSSQLLAAGAVFGKCSRPFCMALLKHSIDVRQEQIKNEQLGGVIGLIGGFVCISILVGVTTDSGVSCWFNGWNWIPLTFLSIMSLCFFLGIYTLWKCISDTQYSRKLRSLLEKGKDITGSVSPTLPPGTSHS
jgi:hypothetical protein